MKGKLYFEIAVILVGAGVIFYFWRRTQATNTAPTFVDSLSELWDSLTASPPGVTSSEGPLGGGGGDAF